MYRLQRLLICLHIFYYYINSFKSIIKTFVKTFFRENKNFSLKDERKLKRIKNNKKKCNYK